MLVPSESPTTAQVLDALRGILEEFELAVSEDAALPGFIISFPIQGASIAFTLEIPFPGLIFLTARMPGEINGDQCLHALVLANEVNRHCRFSTLVLDSENGRFSFHYARSLDGLPTRDIVGSLLRSAVDFATTLPDPIRAITEEKAEWQVVIQKWHDARERLEMAQRNGSVDDDAAESEETPEPTPTPRIRFGKN